MTRFLPNRRASIDHAPGPSKARERLIPAKSTWVQGSLVRERPDQTERAANAPPANGVQSPAESSNPATPTAAGSNNDRPGPHA
jgi:hypothetical protein